MQRVAFQLRIQEGKEEEYDDIHRKVWPELLLEMTVFGIREYSIFRRGRQLFLYLQVPDWDTVLLQLQQSEVNHRWQSRMASFFDPMPDLKHGEAFAMMQEVFYMPGAVLAEDATATKETR